MKQIYFTLLASSFSLASMGQAFVLDNTYNPTTQDKYTSYFLDKTADPGPAGANQAWDFSSLKQDSSFDNKGMAIPASKTALYPSANVAQVTSYGDTTYYQATSTQLVNWGYYSSMLGSTNYSDGQILLKYPFAFGDTFQDSVKGASTIKYNGAKLNTNRASQETVTVDGWGSILLPGQKSYNKVVRIKSVMNGVDKVVGFSNTFASTLTSYTWYAEGLNYPVLTITSINSPGLITDQVVIQSGPYNPAAVVDPAFSKAVALSPNPAQDNLIIQMNSLNSATFSVAVKDATGKTFLQNSITASNGSGMLNVSSLNSGLYFLEIISGEKMAVKKFVKN